VLWGGATAIEDLLTRSRINMGRKAKRGEKLFYPWYTFPIVFFIAWWAILFAKWPIFKILEFGC
jgi:hypothetical protein